MKDILTMSQEELEEFLRAEDDLELKMDMTEDDFRIQEDYLGMAMEMERERTELLQNVMDESKYPNIDYNSEDDDYEED